jgi:hypothetical protein
VPQCPRLLTQGKHRVDFLAGTPTVPKCQPAGQLLVGVSRAEPVWGALAVTCRQAQALKLPHLWGAPRRQLLGA